MTSSCPAMFHHQTLTKSISMVTISHRNTDGEFFFFFLTTDFINDCFSSSLYHVSLLYFGSKTYCWTAVQLDCSLTCSPVHPATPYLRLSVRGFPRSKRRISFSLSISPLLTKNRRFISIGSSSSDEEEEGGSKYDKCSCSPMFFPCQCGVL